MTSTKKTAPLIITGLIVGFILFLIWAALQARNFGPRITDPDYYSKGLRYNTTLVEKRAASVLGWEIRSSISDEQLQVQLLDRDRHPVQGANGLLFLYRSEDDHSGTPLNEIEPGFYVVSLPSGMQGEHRARIEFDSAGARLSRELLLNL